MTIYKKTEIHAIRLPTSVELVQALTAYCREHEIEQAQVLGIGAIRAPEIGSYDFAEEMYRTLALEGDWEMLTLNANVSLKDGEPFAHPHVMLSDADGRVRGGHLYAAEVLVAELTLHVLHGEPRSRVTDPMTKLSLWPAEPGYDDR
jgi:uncharacterized protein